MALVTAIGLMFVYGVIGLTASVGSVIIISEAYGLGTGLVVYASQSFGLGTSYGEFLTLSQIINFSVQWIIYNILSPFILLVLFLMFIVAQYYLIKLYIYIFKAIGKFLENGFKAFRLTSIYKDIRETTKSLYENRY